MHALGGREFRGNGFAVTLGYSITKAGLEGQERLTHQPQCC